MAPRSKTSLDRPHEVRRGPDSQFAPPIGSPDARTDALGELLVLRQGGGAIAAWAPTGLSQNALAVILDKSFFSTAFVDGESILGEVVLKALVDYAGTGKLVYMLDIYNLLGDPALDMR